MPTTAPDLTDKQLKDAMERADMPPRDYRIFGALVSRVDWKTGLLPERFQPRSLEKLAAQCRMSKTAAAEGLNHLESHGWVTRDRQEPGRGRPTLYGVRIGMDCDCKPAAKQDRPRTDAERMRDYRARKASGIRVTRSPEIRVTKRPAERNDAAGQEPFLAERARDEGKGEGRPWRDERGDYTGGPVAWDWPEDSIGAEMNGN